MEKIVFDIYGADAGPEIIVKGVAKAIKTESIFPVLVGDSDLIHTVMQACNVAPSEYEVIHTTEYISHTDSPACIFGGRDNSSMALSLQRLKSDDQCVAMVSAGNTGALLVGSICRLGLFAGLKTPALSCALPCNGEHLICLVDCGANMDCSVNDFVNYAKMGNVFSKCCCGVDSPRVGIMSVGREEGKGTAFTLKAFEQLKQLPLNFVGNLEGGDMVSDYADVVITDGFSGNLLLKNTEAAGKKAMALVEQFASENPELIARIRQALWNTFDFNSQGAATFLGTKKTVVKMHGCANQDTTVSTVQQVLRLERAGFIEQMAVALSE
ncbi:MAG: hypothetical protein IKT68_06495 [Clostridia bacterium]|nr:hypothetical protein [Clostridia bacterium]